MSPRASLTWMSRSRLGACVRGREGRALRDPATAPDLLVTEGMNLKWSGVALSFALLSTIAAPAHAQDDPVPRPAALVFESGLSVPEGPAVGVGLLSAIPHLYGAVSVDARISQTFGWGVTAGGATGLGWMLGATGRVASPWRHGVRFSGGLGPMLDVDSPFGTAWFTTGDATVEVRSRGGWAFVAGPKVAMALESAGVQTCHTNVDFETCSGGHVSPGDAILTFRFGVGGNL